MSGFVGDLSPKQEAALAEVITNCDSLLSRPDFHIIHMSLYTV